MFEKQEPSPAGRKPKFGFLVALCFAMSVSVLVCQFLNIYSIGLSAMFGVQRSLELQATSTRYQGLDEQWEAREAMKFEFLDHQKNGRGHGISTRGQDLSSMALTRSNYSLVIAGMHSNSIGVRTNHTHGCLPRREPVWEKYHYADKDEKVAKKRLLIALYSGFGRYSKLLSMTSKVNRAYAKKWKHDVVLVHGAVPTVESDDGCEPPSYRATFDKIPLLHLGLRKKDKYDQLLIIDTDAMVYDFDVDITTMLSSRYMMAAQKVRPTDEDNTWDVNAGVTLWNLHHPKIRKAADEWEKNAALGMERVWHPANDQYHLHYVLRNGNYSDALHGMKDEFNYGHGTVIRHFIRKPAHKEWGDEQVLDNRQNRIAETMEIVCTKNKEYCDQIEDKVYPE